MAKSKSCLASSQWATASMMASTLVTTSRLRPWGVLKPHLAASRTASLCEAMPMAVMVSASMLYTMQSKGRVATTALSCSLRVPAAVLRGLANSGSPASLRDSFNASNPGHGKKISPRISNGLGAPGFNRSGRVLMVATLARTSSPVVPSPRVKALIMAWPSYHTLMATPSYFNSTTNSTSSSGKPACTRSAHCATSSAL